MSRFEFAGHELDLREGRLSRRGRSIALRPKSFSLLTYLVENAGRVIGKDELAAAIWPNVIVTDDSLTQCIKDIRRTLGDDADGLIETVPRRGYAIDKTRIARIDAENAAIRPRIEKPSVVVLAFVNASGTTAYPWLSHGLAEDLTTALSKSPMLTVVSRAISLDEARRTADLTGPERDIGAQHLLCGSFRLQSRQLRLTAQLIEARSGAVRWAEQFETDIGEFLAIRSEIINAIVERLKTELLSEAMSDNGASRPDDLEAYICYLRARELAHKWTTPLVSKARRLFQRALELDPAYARALAGIAICDAFLREWHWVTVSREKTIETATRALQLDPDISEAYAARGLALFRDGLTQRAFRDLGTALSLDPDCYEANFFYAFMCRSVGDYPGAIRHYERASRLHPTDYVSPNALAGLLPRDDPAIREWARLCVERAERVADLHPEDPGPLCRAAVGLMYLGDEEKARRWIGRAMAIDPEDLIVIYNAASVHALLGDTETTIDLLERYMAGSDRRAAIGTIIHDREFDDIRHHPRYRNLLRVGGL